MASERVRAVQPTLEGVGHALRRAYSLPERDREAADERHLLRRIDLKDAVK